MPKRNVPSSEWGNQRLYKFAKFALGPYIHEEAPPLVEDMAGRQGIDYRFGVMRRRQSSSRPYARARLKTRRPVYRRRVYRRRYVRRTGFKTRVQRATLSLAESKRYQTRATLTSFTDATPQVFPLAAVPESTVLTGITNHKNQRIGTKINATGCRIELHFQNLLTTQAIWVRVIAGYKKYARTSADKDDIFKNPLTEENEELTTSLAYPDYLYATTDRKQFVKVKDFKFRLGGSTESTSMEHFKSLRWWWNMKNRKIEFESFAEGNENQTYDPYFMIYVTNETGVLIAGNLMALSYRTLFYFKDI